MSPPGSPRQSDCWGRLNDVSDLSPVLTILDALPDGFRTARRTMIGRLGLTRTSRVLEAGSGPGTALPDLVEHVGAGGRIIGIDPTRALVAEADARARAAGITQVEYAVGDILEIAQPDASVDAAFCDKILVHVSPIPAALGELARVTRAGGRVGAVEWFSQGMSIAADYTLTRQVLDGSAPAGALNPLAALELERYFADTGLRQVESGSILAEARRWTPGLQVMLRRRVAQAIELGSLTPDAGDAWLAELTARDARGDFYWGTIVRWAVGTRQANA
jgi:ubiquinone/menaquinone biosynthesis C-methylase UbiE